MGITKRSYGDPNSDEEGWYGDDWLYLYLKGADKWYLWYDLIEYCYRYSDKRTKVRLLNRINEVLAEEKAPYRVIDGIVTPLTSSAEIESITEAIFTPYANVKAHLKKALGLYADRLNPDYENSIKESISAVEALCCTITNDKKATLGEALKKLESKGIHLHKAFLNSINSLYGYTSDESGIRHGSIDFAGASVEDAKYMLVACSAFVNYLIEKWEKSK